MVDHRSGARRIRTKDKVAAVEMYLSGPNSMRAVADALGMNVNSLNIWIQRYRRCQPSGG